MKKQVFCYLIALVMVVTLALPAVAKSSQRFNEDCDAYIVMVGESSAVVSRGVFLQIYDEIDKGSFDAEEFVRNAPQSTSDIFAISPVEEVAAKPIARGTTSYSLTKNTIKAGGTTLYKATSSSGFYIDKDGVITVTFNFASTPKSASVFSKKYPSGAESNRHSITTASFTAAIIVVGTGEYSVNVYNGNSAGLVMNSGTIEVTT